MDSNDSKEWTSYAASADPYDRFQAPRTEQVITRLTSLMQLKQRARILDVGCGTGAGVRALAQRYPDGRIAALDIEASLTEHARLSVSAHQSSVVPIVADAEALPFASASFDRVLCAFVLGHLPTPMRALSEIARVLALDGQATLVHFTRPENMITALARSVAANYVELSDIEGAYELSMPGASALRPWRIVEQFFKDVGGLSIEAAGLSLAEEQIATESYVQSRAATVTGRFLLFRLGSSGYATFQQALYDTLRSAYGDVLIEMREVGHVIVRKVENVE
ncbi:class I SAM-dependent methyltransferase [Promicromonospora sukumoe]|uniref:class I SAM-dependent methyltransferase n=1 Tax=Promicromonospora sukumoe TaxID=88382 RepID=UPI0037C53605